MSDNSKKGGNAAKSGSSGSGSDRPQSYLTGFVQKDAHGGQRPKPYGTGKVQEGETRK
jgi:hypothetical protein